MELAQKQTKGARLILRVTGMCFYIDFICSSLYFISIEYILQMLFIKFYTVKSIFNAQ